MWQSYKKTATCAKIGYELSQKYNVLLNFFLVVSGLMSSFADRFYTKAAEVTEIHKNN